MTNCKEDLLEITSKNIIMVKLEEVQEAWKVVEGHMKALKERMKPVVEEMRTLEEKEMQDFLSCFKKDWQGVVTQIKDVVLLFGPCIYQ
jgi:glucose-6-phosphate 1-dehydrogenase